ncbi:hypothetical protein [Streptomyces virginiae]
MIDRADDVGRSGLFHALGPACDTPAHLAALLGDDLRAATDGYAHLWSTSLRHEGKAWPSTAATALKVLDLLDDPALGREDPTLPDTMLAYLCAVGVAADLGERAAPRNAPAEDVRRRGRRSTGPTPLGRRATTRTVAAVDRDGPRRRFPYDPGTILIAIGDLDGDTRP